MFLEKKYAKKVNFECPNYKIREFFNIIISIGVLNSKIVPFKSKFEGHIIKFIIKLVYTRKQEVLMGTGRNWEKPK